MKKIFIFAAVLALLTLSLNAQLKATKNGYVVQPTEPTEKVDIKLDGYFPAGPVRAGEVTPPHTWGFSSSELDGWSYIDANNDNSTWGISSEQARYTYNSSNAADDWLFTPGVYLEAGRIYSFSLDVKAQAARYPERFEVKLLTEISNNGINNATSIIGSTTVDYTTYNTISNDNVTVSTTGYYYFGIHAISDRDQYYLWVDNVVVDLVSDPIHDLSVTLSAPTKVNSGGTITATATVTNTGDYAESGYTVNITANGNVILTQTVNSTLAVGASKTFTVQYATTGSDGGTTVNFGAIVICANDAESSNDNATASTAVIAMPPPENVNATASGQSGTMTWDAPNISSSAITENFDDTSAFPPFSIGGITTSQHTGTIGDWTVYTSSSNSVYAYSNATFDNAYQPQAWTAFNTSISGSYDTHSGNQIMLSFCDAGTGNGQGILTTDHWLISPELSGDAQTITFWERVITDQYGAETYEVLVSSTDTDPSSFSSVQTYSSTSTSWGQRSATLPAGTKYFAIHHTSYDIFGLMIDDVTYVPASIEPVSYNVYLEGILVGNVNANTFSYTFNNLSDGTYQCSVSAVYDGGYESAAVPTTFTIITKNPTIEITPATQTINDATAGSLTVTGTDIDGNINVSAANDWYLNPNSLSNTGGNVSVSYTGRELSATTTVTATDANDNTVSASATVNYVANVYIVGDYGSGWDFNNGTQMTNSNGTYTATITVNANTYILFARLLGNNNPWGSRDVFGPDSNGNWWMQGNSASGDLDLNASNCIYFPDGGTYRITINANDGTFTITKLYGEQTEPPVITSTSDGEYVTITATGAGTVTLNVPGHEPVSGEGEVSITVPCGYASNTINVSATAQESGKDESDPATAQVTIPAGTGWIEMTGTYNNPADLLSFQVKVGNDTLDVTMVDQFRVSTLENNHPDHYTYTLRQTVNGETQTSTPVSIPVYKTNSSIQGLYTLTQVENDTLMQLKANVLNSEMDYYVEPDRNTLYYSLYRGKVNDTYPEITAGSRISQLQRFMEYVGEYPQYFLFESHQQGVAPRYEHIGSQMVERLDTTWVEGKTDDELSYVPVIWTSGLFTARGDGKNNSYGSDIKREVLGGVTAEITGQKSDYKDWGEWEVNGVTYCVYTPVIRITGAPPLTMTSGDGDVNTYVPYMYRAWCTYEGARDFKHNSDGQLIDNGPMTTPILLGTDRSVNYSSIIGGDWNPGDGRLDWAFGVPVDEDSTNVTFVIRFYYKKVVTEAQQGNQNNTLRLGNGESEEYYIVETEGDATSIVTAINEMYNSRVPVSVTYVNAQGMQSSKPFDGINIVVTRYSDGTTRTTKVIR